jgi:isopentenyl-diphosphate Delta-isomerase
MIMTPSYSIGRRKDEHVRYAVDQQHQGFPANDFDSINFVHHALAGIDGAEVSLDTEFAGSSWQTPLYINAMTGGSESTGKINRELAIAARETGLAIASGSMSAYLRDESVAHSYHVLRQENPRGFVIANVNANATVEQARRAVDLLEADALQIHLNAMQEIVMPEGDRDFSHWPRQIERICASMPMPVIVKEVGFGLSRNTVELLRNLGVAVADVGGRGGTNFARIENNRRQSTDLSYLSDWGQSTACCLLTAADVTGIQVAASGGVRSPLDIARALALGARATGVAGHFLEILMDHGVDRLITTIREWLDQLSLIMTVLGARTPWALTNCDVALTGRLETYCRLLDIDPRRYARRTLRSPDSPDSPEHNHPAESTRERIPR